MVLDLKPALVSSQYDISLIPNILQLRILSNCEHSPIPNITLYVYMAGDVFVGLMYRYLSWHVVFIDKSLDWTVRIMMSDGAMVVVLGLV